MTKTDEDFLAQQEWISRLELDRFQRDRAFYDAGRTAEGREARFVAGVGAFLLAMFVIVVATFITK